GVLGPPSGGIDGPIGQEGEQGVLFNQAVFDQLAVLGARVGLLAQQFAAFGRVGDDRSAGIGVEVFGGEGLAQKVAHFSWSAPSPARQIGDQLVTASGQMGQTRLMGGVAVLAVGGPAVSDDGPGEVFVDHLGGLVETAAVSHVVVGDL